MRIILPHKQTSRPLFLPKRLLPVYSVRTYVLQYVAPPLPIDGKMATENCDMDPDMEMLSDEEIERYYNLTLCCQRQKCVNNEASH